MVGALAAKTSWTIFGTISAVSSRNNQEFIDEKESWSRGGRHIVLARWENTSSFR